VWYPGSEPGGGGYIAQRMLAAKNEKHAMGATLFFNFAHYAIRPWPWIIVALSSIIAFPTLESIRHAFPNIDPSIIRHDMAYPAMLTYLPTGVLGFVIASLIAAYMSTMSTSLNWGSSYVVNDFYKRFIKPNSTEKHLVLIGRLSTVLMMVLASFFALYMQSALSAFNILLQIGAGTGLLFLLRWFWWRINAFSEITAMIVSFLVAIFFLILSNYHNSQIDLLIASGLDRVDAIQKVGPLKTYEELIIGVSITTISWIIATLFTKPTSTEKLISFYKLVHPGGKGWDKITSIMKEEDKNYNSSFSKSYITEGILGMVVGCIGIYSLLFAIGYWLYSKFFIATGLSIVAVVCSFLIFKIWNKLHTD
ncbi:MAG: Na+:solute symporter, partial [Ignavibacteria bacterium]|nr:Na+:solute symporter [Ignavibacteria bacterium]